MIGLGYNSVNLGDFQTGAVCDGTIELTHLKLAGRQQYSRLEVFLQAEYSFDFRLK